MESLIPPQIEFSRRRIIPSDAAKDQEQSGAIFGSVSIADIVSNIKALLAMRATEEGNEDAARVVLQAEDIRLLHKGLAESDESDRVKTLGEFEIEIHPKGAVPIQRSIKVREEQS